MLINRQNPHGGQIYDKKIRADFSVNVNPQGMPKRVIEEAYRGIISSEQYPDASCGALRQAISEKDKVKPEHIICGNGGAELIFQAALALKPKKALIIEPTFCEYRQALEAVDCEVKTHQLKAEGSFDINAEAECILEQITEDTDMVFICNPNNPTGFVTSKDNVEKLLRRCSEAGVTLFVDESFGELTKGYDGFSVIDKVEANPELFVLKSLTKTYAMAGIRIGYGLCSDDEMLKKMCEICQCWNVSLVAQRAGIAALQCAEYVRDTLEILETERTYLTEELEKLHIKVFKGETNYLMLHCDEGLYDLMLEKGILIRSCANFRGLGQDYFRIAIKDHHQNEMLIEALKDISKEVDLCTRQA